MSDCGRDCDCRGDVSRRDFLKLGAGTAGLIYGTQAARAAPGDIPDANRVPPPQSWFDELTKSGGPITYTGEHLRNLIFPLGGIGTGTIWLHGSGRLVNWQIFNNIRKDSLVDDSFFAVRVEQRNHRPVVRVLQQQPVGPLPGIRDIRFVGRYPVATVTFSDPDLPIDLELEACNPLIPLDAKESAIPCAVFTLRAVNRSPDPVRVSLVSSLQNAVGHSGKGASQGPAHGTYGGNVNEAVVDRGMTAVAMRAHPGQPARLDPPVELFADHQQLPRLEEAPVQGLSFASIGAGKTNAAIRTVYWIAEGDLQRIGGAMLSQIADAVRHEGAALLVSGTQNPLQHRVQANAEPGQARRETVFASFDQTDFGPWTAKGNAFKRPHSGTIGNQSPVTGFLGAGLVNTFDPNDRPKGTLTSPEFVIRERYISLLVGGGQHPDACCVNLLVDGKVVRTATGKNREHLERVKWDVAEFEGADARIEIVDSKSNPWGHVLVDDIRFGNLPVGAVTAEEADSWNGLVDEMKRAGAMKAIGVGRGHVMRVPLDLASDQGDTDPVVRRDRVLQIVAALADVKYDPQVGRPVDAPSFGTMCLATPDADAALRIGWTDREELFRALTKGQGFVVPERHGHVTESIPAAGPSAPGQTVNAALSVSRNLVPGGSAEATFVATWHFPNQYYPQNAYRAGANTAAPVGNMYANWFHDATTVARYVLANHDRLRRRTFAYRDALFDTTLPQYLVDCVAANASIIRSPTCFWAKDGTFFGFEGCRPTGGGCCPMNCNHVWNYEQALAKLWPAVERDMRKTELKFHQRDDGGTNHRVTVPRDNPHKTAPPVADGQCGAVLKAYREHLQSRDRRFLDDYWPHVKKAMDFAINEWDPDHDGVMEKPQFNTYDRVIYGHNSFVSSLYLAALRAAEEMARLSNDDGAAERYRGLFDSGSKIIAETLFDDGYYIQKADNINLGYGTGCWSDQVVGQWWARILNLGDILPAEQVGSALTSIFKYNWLWKTAGFEGTQRFLQFGDGDDKGLLCGSWPRGGRPDDPIFYRDEYWTGVEYQVAGHKLYERQITGGLAIVKGARERYDGRKKSPWNEIECGDYYARAMSSWSLLLAAQGYAYDGPTGRLAFEPRLAPEDHRSFFTTAEAWGTFAQKRAGRTQTATLAFIDGRCPIKELRLGLPAEAAGVKGTARLNDRALSPKIALDAGAAMVDFGSPVTAQADDTLHVELRWD